MESYNKLVRDKIPDILDQRNIPYEKRIADQEEYKQELFNKLDEELKEFQADRSIEELADILEVIYALKKLPEYENVLTVQNDKYGSTRKIDEELTQDDKQTKEQLLEKFDATIGLFKQNPGIEQMADILEDIYELRKLPEYENVLTVQNDKRGEKGGFDERIILKGEKYK